MEKLFLTYLNAGFFGSVLILVGLLLRPFLKNAPRRILCIVWLLVAVRLLLPFNLESSFSLQPRYVPSVTVLSEQEQQEQTPAEPLVTNPIVLPSPVLPETGTEIAPLPPETPGIPVTPVQPTPDVEPVVPEVPVVQTPTLTAPKTVDMMQMLPIIWVTAMAAVCVYGLVSYLVLKRRVQTAVRCADGTLECGKINSAFLLGYFKPEIYLPTGLSAQDRAFIIAHEQTHIQRKDHWWKLVGLLCVSIHWYNPLVWVGYALMCRDIEIACDEQVVQSMNLEDRKAYSLALLNSGKRLSGMLACPVAFGEVSLKQRIQKVLAYRQPKFWMTAIAISLVVFVAFCFLTSPAIEPEPGPSLQAGETQPSTEVDNDDPTDVTEPPATGHTEPPVTEPTEPPATEPTEPPVTEPTDPPATKPTDQDQTGGVAVIAEGKWDGGPVRWKVTSDGTLTITGNRSIQGKTSYIWKDYSDVITKIVIADGITSIPEKAFSKMHNVTEVYLSNTLKTMYRSAFSQCTALQSVTIPAMLTEIPHYAFYGCTSLSKLEFAPGSQVATIGENAFAKTAITGFSAPESLRTIEFYAFDECYSMQTVFLQGGVETVEAYAFRNCVNLKHLVLGESITRAHEVFGGCNALETVEIYTSASYGGFADHTSLRSVIIGGKTTKLFGFSGCTALSNVTITAPIKTVEGYAFENCVALTSITLPDTVTSIGICAFANTGLTKLVLPAAVNELSIFVFSGTNVSEIVFTGDCPVMWDQTFSGVFATAYYPADNETWTKDKLQSYGGNLTWIPYTSTESEGVI